MNTTFYTGGYPDDSKAYYGLAILTLRPEHCSSDASPRLRCRRSKRLYAPLRPFETA